MKRITVKHIADETEVHSNTIRNWCDKGLISCKKTYNGIRWFPDKEKAIQQIKILLGLI